MPRTLPFHALPLLAVLASMGPALAAPPASPEAAAKLLDLRTFPLLEGGKLVGLERTLSRLMYEAKATPAAAFEFQKKELARRGFTELKGTYTSAETNVAHFAKDGFTVAVSTSKAYEPEKAGFATVTVINHGNVDLQQLPTPPGVQPFHPTPTEASYTTGHSVADAAAACRKLLLAAGWEPYGEAPAAPNQPEMALQSFKQNAIRLELWVTTAAGAGNKTLIRYNTELMQADLPAPADVANPDYTDEQKTLRFDAPKAQADAILTFYQDRMTKLGWKATTDKPIVDEPRKLTFLIFRNAAKDLLSLDLQHFNAIVRVKLTHQTEAEVAEEERLAKAAAQKERLAEAERNRKFKVALPVPAQASKMEKLKENVYEFTLAAGAGPATLQQLREHYVKDGWKETEGTSLEKNAGNLTLKKDQLEVELSYFDVGFGDMEVKVSGSFNVVFETVGKVAAKTAPKAAKPAAPGIPGLPPGIDLPDDVKKELEDALKGVQPPAKKSGK